MFFKEKLPPGPIERFLDNIDEIEAEELKSEGLEALEDEDVDLTDDLPKQ